MKKALLVGINRYPDPRNELKGCVNDVRMVENTLRERYGFGGGGSGSVRILIDARATRKAILEGVSWLTAGASPGDSLVFHYSGHGSQVPDRNGDEADRLDEILCPYDLDWAHPLTDDDLAAACAAIPKGALLTVILDCCHSGTGLREFAPSSRDVYSRLFSGAASARSCVPGTLAAAADMTRLRFLPHPDARHPAPSRPRRPARRFGVSVTRTNAVLIAACRDDQTSADALIDGGYHGAHTYHLCRALREADAAPAYRDLVSAAGAALARAGFDQIPQLEGPSKLLGLPVFQASIRE